MINAIRNYWDIQPCNSGWGKPFDEGSPQWFKAIERERESSYPDIAKFANYQEWKGKKVLEIGCGLGCDTTLFAQAGANITAVDLSPRSASLTRKHLDINGLTGNIECLNAEQLPFANNSFDYCYSFGVIHHSEYPEKIISEIFRVLKPDGIFRGMMYSRYGLVSIIVYLLDVRKHHNPFVSLKTVYGRSVESPDTKAYSNRELRAMFSKFSKVKVKGVLWADERIFADSPRIKILAPLFKFYPDFFASWMLIEAVK